MKAIGLPGLIGLILGFLFTMWLDPPNDNVRYAIIGLCIAIGALFGSVLAKKKPPEKKAASKSDKAG